MELIITEVKFQRGSNTPLTLMPYIPKDTKNRSLLYGDFDNDNVKNIDDKYPFNKKKKQNSSEVMLSEELRKMRKASLNHRDILGATMSDLRKQGFKVKGRVKRTTSIVNKLRRKYLSTIKDFAGAMVIVHDINEAYDIQNFIKDNYNVIEIEDFYSQDHPTGSGYKAIHMIIEREGKYMEIQIKRAEDYQKAMQMHTAYKRT